MFWLDMVFIILFALILSGILIWALGWRHPAESQAVGASILFLFLVLMLTMWVGSAWVPPWGPVFYGSAWFSLLVIGIVISLIILAVAAPARRPRTTVVVEKDREPPEPGTVFGIFFWILLIVLLLAAVMSYVR